MFLPLLFVLSKFKLFSLLLINSICQATVEIRANNVTEIGNSETAFGKQRVLF